jgi:SAM-dependent methyltransferase
MTKKDTLSELLNVFWLRPETALWRELDIRAMESFAFNSPSLDVGCGDGLFAFIRSGGKFDSKFDAFRAMSGMDKFFENVDIFDSFNEQTNPVVVKLPEYQINCGFDHKENLLKKAGQLGLYASLKQGDANQPLPFADESFNSIFSNIVYWLDDPQSVLMEMGRILRPGGKACLMLPNKTLPEFSFYNQLFVKTGDPRWAFLEKLDRGRFSDNIRQARSQSAWEVMFKSAGLQVVGHKAHLSKTAIQTWDIGLRPLFPVLLKMTEAIPANDFVDIKSEWITTLRQFLEPLIDMDGSLNQGQEPAFHCYILEK